MNLELEELKSAFTTLVQQTDSEALVEFVFWLDVKVAEYKINGHMVFGSQEYFTPWFKKYSGSVYINHIADQKSSIFTQKSAVYKTGKHATHDDNQNYTLTSQPQPLVNVTSAVSNLVVPQISPSLVVPQISPSLGIDGPLLKTSQPITVAYLTSSSGIGPPKLVRLNSNSQPKPIAPQPSNTDQNTAQVKSGHETGLSLLREKLVSAQKNVATNHLEIIPKLEPLALSNDGSISAVPQSAVLDEEAGERKDEDVHNENGECAEVSSELPRAVSQNLRDDVVQVAGESVFMCRKCSRYFRHLSNYSRHLKLHQGVTSYTCSGCQRGFYRKEHFEKHSCDTKPRKRRVPLMNDEDSVSPTDNMRSPRKMLKPSMGVSFATVDSNNVDDESVDENKLWNESVDKDGALDGKIKNEPDSPTEKSDEGIKADLKNVKIEPEMNEEELDIVPKVSTSVSSMIPSSRQKTTHKRLMSGGKMVSNSMGIKNEQGDFLSLSSPSVSSNSSLSSQSAPSNGDTAEPSQSEEKPRIKAAFDLLRNLCTSGHSSTAVDLSKDSNANLPLYPLELTSKASVGPCPIAIATTGSSTLTQDVSQVSLPPRTRHAKTTILKRDLLKKDQNIVFRDGELQYKCPECSRCFRHHSNFSRHKKIHGEPEYGCEKCGRRFHRKEYLKTHNCRKSGWVKGGSSPKAEDSKTNKTF